MRSLASDIEEGLAATSDQPRLVLLELDISFMQVYAASAPLGYLAGKQLTEIFSDDMSQSFQKLWNDISLLEEKGELAQKVMSFSNIEMRYSTKRTAQISGTVEVTKTATGELEIFLCFRMPSSRRKPSGRRSFMGNAGSVGSNTASPVSPGFRRLSSPRSPWCSL